MRNGPRLNAPFDAITQEPDDGNEMILRHLPDLSASNASFRASFFSARQWENCIILGRTRHAEYASREETLSIKAAWGGREEYLVSDRRLAVDDDTFLILNSGRTYTSSINARRPVESFVIFFRPGLAQEVLGSLVMPHDRILEGAEHRSPQPVEFIEQLQPHD